MLSQVYTAVGATSNDSLEPIVPNLLADKIIIIYHTYTTLLSYGCHSGTGGTPPIIDTFITIKQAVSCLSSFLPMFALVEVLCGKDENYGHVEAGACLFAMIQSQKMDTMTI